MTFKLKIDPDLTARLASGSEGRLSDIIAGDETAADRPDVYAITLRIAGEYGATNATDLTEAITHAVAQLDEAHGIYVVQPVIAQKVNLDGDAGLIDEHLDYALTENGLDGRYTKVTIERDGNGISLAVSEPTDISDESPGITAEVTEHHFRAW